LGAPKGEQGFVIDPALDETTLKLIGTLLPNLDILEPTFIVGKKYPLDKIYTFLIYALGASGLSNNVSLATVVNSPNITAETPLG
jgi:hypothetical protein